MKRKKSTLEVGDIVHFHSGNFEGLDGEVLRVDWASRNPRATHGFYHKVKLSNGRIGHIEKSEHWDFKEQE